ncbi:hypothetical protein F4781DRAFT_331710 [Annulohypoxylon bovei var. microspora]|nr:hypothetical protein F4781DRAFT_331710 [Annulohypoxylon bovei var. microspora]
MPPRTRRSTAAQASNTENPNIESTSNSTPKNSKAVAKGRKRASIESDPSDEPKPKSRTRAKKSATPEPDAVPAEEQKPRLTTPDLEFDYDRSQLRDPRPTPGRVTRPRRDRYDMPEGFKERFFIPQPEKPKGRLNAFFKNKLSKEASLLDPSDPYHDEEVCLRKGRGGSPTYDSAGFELDRSKVERMRQPQAYNKSRIVKGMEKTLAKGERDSRSMNEIFFVDGKEPDTKNVYVDLYLKDHVSKDLGIPWHQIGPEELLEWEKKGFPKQRAEDWWREPNEVERARMSKMLSGSSMRMDL